MSFKLMNNNNNNNYDQGYYCCSCCHLYERSICEEFESFSFVLSMVKKRYSVLIYVLCVVTVPWCYCIRLCCHVPISIRFQGLIIFVLPLWQKVFSWHVDDRFCTNVAENVIFSIGIYIIGDNNKMVVHVVKEHCRRQSNLDLHLA